MAWSGEHCVKVMKRFLEVKKVSPSATLNRKKPISGVDESKASRTIVVIAIEKMEYKTENKNRTMEILKFKTTIKCSGCVAQATPFLNNAVGANNWKVDIQNPEKTLTVDNKEGVNQEDIIKAVKEAGYKAERVD